MILTKQQILESKDLVTKTVEVPEWGGEVLVRALSNDEANEWRRSMLSEVVVTDKAGKRSREQQFNQQKAEKANAQMLSIAIVDEEGKRIFTSADVDALGAKSLSPISRIVKVVMAMSGLSQKASEDAEAFSEPSQNESSVID